MKKIFSIIILCALVFSSYSQDTTTVNQVLQTTQQVLQTAKSFEGAITPYVVQLMEGVKAGAEFVGEEIPIIIQQFLMFKSVSLGICLFLGLFLIFSPKLLLNLLTIKKENLPENTRLNKNLVSYGEVYYSKIGNKYIRRIKDADGSVEFFLFIFGTIVLEIVGITLILIYTLPFIKVTFFPKLYLLETFINTMQ